MDIRAAEISSILKKQIKDFGKDKSTIREDLELTQRWLVCVVQHVIDITDESAKSDEEVEDGAYRMRHVACFGLLVQCVARMLILGNGVPSHWQKALSRNGQLAVDIILTVQKSLKLRVPSLQLKIEKI